VELTIIADELAASGAALIGKGSDGEAAKTKLAPPNANSHLSNATTPSFSIREKRNKGLTLAHAQTILYTSN